MFVSGVFSTKNQLHIIDLHVPALSDANYACNTKSFKCTMASQNRHKTYIVYTVTPKHEDHCISADKCIHVQYM